MAAYVAMFQKFPFKFIEHNIKQTDFKNLTDFIEECNFIFEICEHKNHKKMDCMNDFFHDTFDFDFEKKKQIQSNYTISFLRQKYKS